VWQVGEGVSPSLDAESKIAQPPRGSRAFGTTDHCSVSAFKRFGAKNKSISSVGPGNTKPEFFWFNVEQGRVADTRD
jgi:hypothetical protein